MKLLTTILGILFFLFLAFWLIPFCCFFVKNLLTIKKIDKKIDIICIEYENFIARQKFAEEQGIGYSDPFTVTLQTDKLLVTTRNLSQAKYLNILKDLANDLDTILSNTSENLIEVPFIKEKLSYFYRVKQGIADANPYR